MADLVEHLAGIRKFLGSNPVGSVFIKKILDCTTDKGDTEQLLFFVKDSADVPLLGHKACDKRLAILPLSNHVEMRKLWK